MSLQNIYFCFVLKFYKENLEIITKFVDSYAADFDGPVIKDGAYDWLKRD